MEIYSEYFGAGRKASVTRLKRSWDPRFDVFEVAMYVNNNIVQRTTCNNEEDAENMAESFCQGGDGTSVLLNEHITNG